MRLVNSILGLFGLALVVKGAGVLDQQSPVTGGDGGRLTAAQVFRLADQLGGFYGLNVAPQFVTTIASIESSFNTTAFRDEGFDQSYGLMQTLWTTAKDMQQKGYDAFPLKNPEDLFNPGTSLYYGMAYLDWLQRNFGAATLEQLARKYNGGPFGDQRPTTLAYAEKFRERSGYISNKLATQGIA